MQEKLFLWILELVAGSHFWGGMVHVEGAYIVIQILVKAKCNMK